MVISLFYGFFNDPYYIAFKMAGHNDDEDHEDNATEESNMTIEVTIDVILTINILVSALTSYIKNNKWVTDIKKLLFKYARGPMIIDFLMVIPTLASG